MNFNTSKPSAGIEIDLTPLINIVFLILIFFMLAGTLKSADGIQAAEMESAEIVEQKTLVINMARDGSLAVDGEIVARENLIQQLRTHQQSDGKISIKPDARLAAEELLSVSQLLRDAGFTQMTLIVDSQ